MIERKRHGRKLLIASLGVAAVNYVACGAVANLMPTPADDSGTPNAGGDDTGGTTNTGGAGGTDNAGGNSSTGGAGQGGSAGSSGNIQDAAVDKTVIRLEDVLIANLIPPPPPPPDAKDDSK